MSNFINIGYKKDPALDLTNKDVTKRYAFRAYARMSNPDDLATAISLETVHFFMLNSELGDEHGENQLIIVDKSNTKFELINRVLLAGGKNVAYKDIKSEINKEMFVSLRNRVSVGYKVQLYRFPVLDRGDTFWEVMRFWGTDGQFHPWVIISCEDEKQINPLLPFKIKECILENDPNNSIELDNFIKDLWLNQYAKIDERDIIKI